MSEYEYKVGDKVLVVNDTVDGGAFRGKTGVVEGVRAGLWPIRVSIDGSGSIYPDGVRFTADELKLVEAANPVEPDMVEHPNHYSAGTPDGVEVIDILRAHEAAGGTWETMNALKYILRFPFKGNAAQDLAKAEQYLSMWKERESA